MTAKTTKTAALTGLGVLLFLLMGIRGGAWAQEPPKDLTQVSLEDLMNIKVESVYGASKHLQKVTQAPASITLITADDIRHHGYRTLGDVLRSVPGFYITYDRNYTYAAVRGFGRTGDYNSRILLLLDGHRLNDDVLGQALFGTEFPVDLDLIDRVEVIHGPGSSIYGNNAFFAVINIVTKRARVAAGLQVAGAEASYDTGYTRITYGGEPKQGWEALVSSSFYDSHGQERLFFKEFDSPATNNGIAQDSDHDKFRQVFANLSHKDVSLQVVYGSREKGIPTASFGTVFNDSRAQSTDRRGYADLSYEHQFGKGLDLAGHIYFDSETFDEIFPYNYSAAGKQVTLNHAYTDGKWWGEEIKLFKPIFTRHRLTVGEEYRDNFRETQGDFDVSPYHVYLNDHRRSQVWALYAQDEYSIRKNLMLNVGLRHDQDYTYGGTTNPRVALIYNPWAQTTLKLLYGNAFRAPSAFESYVQGNGFVANLKLKPETIHTAEIVAEQYVGDHYRFSGSIFQNNLAHLIDEEPLPSGLRQFQNVDAVRAKGVELVFERKWDSGLSAQVNYTYEHAVDPQTGVVLHNSPAHLANVNLLVPVLPKKLTAGLDLHYISARQTLAGNTAPGFVVTNVTLFSQRLFKGIELSGSVYNLFGTRYGYPGGNEHVQDILYQDGRSARLKLAYTLGGHRK